MLHNDDLSYFVTDKVTSVTILSPSLNYFSQLSSVHVYDGEVDTCVAVRSTRVLL